MSGPESQTLTLNAPAWTGIETSTVPVPLTDLKMLSLRVNEKGLRRRIWSLTATITWPSEIGESKRSRRVDVPEAAAGAGVGSSLPRARAGPCVGFLADATAGRARSLFAASGSVRFA